MFFRLLLAAAPFLALSSAALHAQSAPPAPRVSEQDLRRHIEILASDDFEGRQPGTVGETKTLAYLSKQMAALGLEPAAGQGRWYQPVGIVTRRPFAHRSTWTANGSAIDFDQANGIFIGKDASVRIDGAPVWFVGHGAVLKDGKVDQLAGADLKGAVALILYDAPKVPDFPSYAERVKAVTAAGAAAVIGVVSEEIPWSSVTSSYSAGQHKLQSEAVPAVQGAMPVAAAARLVGDAGGDFKELLGQPGPSFKPVSLKLRASLDISTRVHAYTTHNVIGRLRGTGGGKESLLYLAHWDHMGICRPEGEADRICNGAVDNASGLAMLLETARHLARGPRPMRDILFMGTTSEEIGLLGAQHFANEPPVPLVSIVAALNLDTVAVAPAGGKVAILGRGTTALDPIIDETARQLGREPDTDREESSFLNRQDGWVLTKAGVPAVMVGSSFADMGPLGSFLGDAYHKPEDDLDHPIQLGGAAEDTELLVALGRKLADPKIYQRPAR
jgi:Zn-dependent M28 family amino/carboxypeptidase